MTSTMGTLSSLSTMQSPCRQRISNCDSAGQAMQSIHPRLGMAQAPLAEDHKLLRGEARAPRHRRSSQSVLLA